MKFIVFVVSHLLWFLGNDAASLNDVLISFLLLEIFGFSWAFFEEKFKRKKK